MLRIRDIENIVRDVLLSVKFYLDVLRVRCVCLAFWVRRRFFLVFILVFKVSFIVCFRGCVFVIK